MTDRDQRAARRAGQRDKMENEQGFERENNQYSTAESEGEHAEDGNRAGSSRRPSGSMRNRSVSRGRNAIMDTVKLTLPVFKGRKKADPDVHIQAFEQWAKMKGVDMGEYGDFFSTTLKEVAQKWYFTYPPEKLPTYEMTKRAFVLRFRDDKTDEDILCELGKMKERKSTVRKYVEKQKDLTRQLESQPSDKNLRAWFLNGCKSKRLKNAEVTNATVTFEELIARALKMESKKKKRKSSTDESELSSSTSSEESTESSSSDSGEKKKKHKHKRKASKREDSDTTESEDNRRTKHGRRKGKRTSQDRMIEQLTKKIEEMTAQRIREPSRGEKWCVKCRMSNHSTDECKQCEFCGARGHLWENCGVRLKLMLKQGQEVRMVAGTSEAGETSGNNYAERGTGRGSWRGGRAGRGPRIYTYFKCGKEGHFAADCPDKNVTKDVTPAVSFISSVVAVNAVTRSQKRLLLEDVKVTEPKVHEAKAKGKQIVKDELAEQCQLAAKLTEVFSQMKPEQPETSSAREITKIPGKPLTDPLKAPKLGYAHYIRKQEMLKEQVRDQEKIPDKLQEGGEIKNSLTINKKVKFAENIQQWIPLKQPSGALDQEKNIPDKESQGVDYQGKVLKQSTERNTNEKKAKRPNKELSKQEKGSASSRKAAKVRTEWQVRITDGSNESASSSDYAPEHEEVVREIKKPHEQESKECCHKKTDKRRSSRQQKWMPKPACDISVSEPSSIEGSDNEEKKEYIYAQVCKRINQLTIELDKLRQALPACEAFIDQYKKKKQQAEVMTATTATIKDDQVPTIQVECKVRKHWKHVNGVVVDGGAGVNIMDEHTQRALGITEMKEAPFRVRMADQRVVQPLGLVENIQVKTGGAKFSVSFLVLDVGDAYSMLLGRPWLKIAEAIHDWTTNTITLRSKGKKVFLNTNPKQVNDTQKPELLCQKQTPKQIEKMLASLNIVPTAEIDLNVILADMEKRYQVVRKQEFLHSTFNPDTQHYQLALLQEQAVELMRSWTKYNMHCEAKCQLPLHPSQIQIVDMTEGYRVSNEDLGNSPALRKLQTSTVSQMRVPLDLLFNPRPRWACLEDMRQEVKSLQAQFGINKNLFKEKLQQYEVPAKDDVASQYAFMQYWMQHLECYQDMIEKENNFIIQYLLHMPDTPVCLYGIKPDDDALPHFFPVIYPFIQEPKDAEEYVQITDQLKAWRANFQVHYGLMKDMFKSLQSELDEGNVANSRMQELFDNINATFQTWTTLLQ